MDCTGLDWIGSREKFDLFSIQSEPKTPSNVKCQRVFEYLLHAFPWFEAYMVSRRFLAKLNVHNIYKRGYYLYKYLFFSTILNLKQKCGYV